MDSKEREAVQRFKGKKKWIAGAVVGVASALYAVLPTEQAAVINNAFHWLWSIVAG